MKNLLLILIMTVLTTGCVKLQVNPEGLISESVDAGKELYQTIKRKRNDEEERKYTQLVTSATVQSDGLNSVQCKAMIRDNIKGSSLELIKILSESSEVAIFDGERKVKCEIVALVKPN